MLRRQQVLETMLRRGIGDKFRREVGDKVQ